MRTLADYPVLLLQLHPDNNPALAPGSQRVNKRITVTKRVVVSLLNISALLFIVPIYSTRAAHPTFSRKAHSFQLQVELPDKLDAFCSRRPKSPSTAVVF